MVAFFVGGARFEPRNACGEKNFVMTVAKIIIV